MYHDNSCITLTHPFVLYFLFFSMTAMVSTSMLTTCMSFPMVMLMERTLRINLKCLYVSKVLENLSIFICYCYSHDTFSFFYCIFLVNLLFVTPSKAAVAALTVTDYEIPTLNFKRMSINESICYFLSGNLVNTLDRRSCDLHRFCTLLLTVTFLVQKTDCLVLIYRQNNGRFFLSIICRKKF